jgi:hypothetical protein
MVRESLIMFAILLSFSCTDETPLQLKQSESMEYDPNQDIACQLLGPDIANCICCGGFLLRVPHGDCDSIVYKFDRMPEGTSSTILQLEYPEDFPVTVLVKYVADEERSCFDNYIKVNSISLR